MNIFILSESPIEAAQMQCNRHVVKMIVESGQMLSTVHRMLDGDLTQSMSKSGRRKVKYYLHPNPYLEKTLYKAVHFNHPCTVWTRESSANYHWHYQHFIALCNEYTYRYGKKHRTHEILGDILKTPPINIKVGELTPFKLAMGSNPECVFEHDPIKSYRLFYMTKQQRFKMEWTRREVPNWFHSER